MCMMILIEDLDDYHNDKTSNDISPKRVAVNHIKGVQKRHLIES